MNFKHCPVLFIRECAYRLRKRQNGIGNFPNIGLYVPVPLGFRFRWAALGEKKI